MLLYLGRQIQFDIKDLYFVVSYFPGAAERFLKRPLAQFTNREIPSDDIQRNFHELVELICDASSFDELISLFEEFHRPHRGEDNPGPFLVIFLLDRINNASGVICIHDLSQNIGFSTLHISNVFEMTQPAQNISKITAV